MISNERSPSIDPSDGLAYVDIKPILSRLGDVTTRIVLVGGQAVNFWADYYSSRVLALAQEYFTSKDIDFCGDRTAVRLCAERLGGQFRLAGMDDHTPNTGIVTFIDEHGIKRIIDFIDQPYGLRAGDVRKTALPIEVLDEDGNPTGVGFKVMHPVWCMMSRVCNTMGLPGYATSHALKQLRASVLCAREFLLDLVEGEEYRAVIKLNERIFKFCHDSDPGLRVKSAHGIDPFDAVVVDDRLPEVFRQRRYPQMVSWLKAKRKRLNFD